MKQTRSFRLDPYLLEQAKKLKINLVSLFEEAIKAKLKIKSCPACGRKLK